MADRKAQVQRWLHSLQAQLILWAILPVTLVVIGLALTGVYTHEAAMRRFVVSRDTALARMYANELEDALSDGQMPPTSEGLSAWVDQQATLSLPSIMVIDGTGNVLASEEPALDTSIAGDPGMDTVLHATYGGFMVKTGQGLRVVTFSVVPGTDWRVVLHEPNDSLLGPILRLSGLGPVAALVAAGLSVLILAFGWRTIVRPLQRLSNAAGQVSWGHYAAIRNPVSGVEEVEELHRALLDMVTRLEGYQAGVLDYLDAMTRGQEEERARLARELHDGPVQALIALGQRVELAEHRVERGEVDEALALLDDVRTAEVDVVEDLRRIIGALRPAYLEDLGFVPALETLLRNAGQHSGVAVRLEVADDLPRLAPEAELAAYRIVQEALNNALQHAQADTITVTVAPANDDLYLRISDDGVGFQPAERLDTYTRQRHYGLVGLQERVRQLGGALRLDASPGHGTTLHAWLPAGVVEPQSE